MKLRAGLAATPTSNFLIVSTGLISATGVTGATGASVSDFGASATGTSSTTAGASSTTTSALASSFPKNWSAAATARVLSSETAALMTASD